MERYQRDWPEERKAEFIRHEIDTCYEPMSPEERKRAEAGLRSFLEDMSDPRVNWDFKRASRIYGHDFYGVRDYVPRSRLSRFFDPVSDLLMAILSFFDENIRRMKRWWRQR